MAAVELQEFGKPISDEKFTTLLTAHGLVQELSLKYLKFLTPKTAIPLLTEVVADNLTYIGFWIRASDLTSETKPLWLDFFSSCRNLVHVDLRGNEDWPPEFTQTILEILVSAPNLSQLQLSSVPLNASSITLLESLITTTGTQIAEALELPSKRRRAEQSSQISVSSDIYELSLANTRPSRRASELIEFNKAMLSLVSHVRKHAHLTTLAHFETDSPYLLPDGRVNTEPNNLAFLRKTRAPFTLLDELSTQAEMTAAMYKSIDAAASSSLGHQTHRLWVFEDSKHHVHALRLGEKIGSARPWGIYAVSIRVIKRVGHMVEVASANGRSIFVEAEYLEPLHEFQGVRTQVESDLREKPSSTLPLGCAVEFVPNRTNCRKGKSHKLRVTKDRCFLGVVVGQQNEEYVVASPSWNEDGDSARSIHLTAVVPRSNCAPAGFFKWDVNKPSFYFLSQMTPETIDSFEMLPYSRISVFTSSTACLVDRRSVLEAQDWLRGLCFSNTSRVNVLSRKTRSPAKAPKTKKLSNSSVTHPISNARVLSPSDTAFDPNFYESRKLICNAALMTPQPKTYGSPLVPCFFIAWETVGNQHIARVTLYATNRDEVLKSRHPTAVVPEYGVFFINTKLAINQGLSIPPEQDKAFSKFAYPIGPVIMQPSPEEHGYQTTIRVIPKRQRFAALSVLNLTHVSTLGNGVDVRESRVPNGGRGLYAMRSFEPFEIITLYTGHMFSESQRKGMQVLGLGTHCKPLHHKLVFLDGVKVALKGMHVAQLANDGGSSANASFLTVDEVPFTGDRVIAIQANRFIFPGEEIYLNYGLKFWSEQNQQPIAIPDVNLPIIENTKA